MRWINNLQYLMKVKSMDNSKFIGSLIGAIVIVGIGSASFAFAQTLRNAKSSLSSASNKQAQPLEGATTPQPEFTRGGGGCSQFGRIDPGPIDPQGRDVVDRVLQELIMRRCVMEGVPVAEEDRIHPLIQALTAGVRANLGNDAAVKAQYDTFLTKVRPILKAEQMVRVEAHVAAAIAPNTAPLTSDSSQMITVSRLGESEQLPEFHRGAGCTVIGGADPGNVSSEVQQAVSRVVLQSVFRRCLLENVPLTAAEDERLFPALKALAEEAGTRQYQQFVAIARQTLDPVRAARVEANVAMAVRGL
jgi:hypothetical protein